VEGGGGAQGVWISGVPCPPDLEETAADPAAAAVRLAA